MKKNYIKPVIGIQTIEPCEIMTGSDTPIKPTNVLVGDLGTTQIPQENILIGGKDATEDVTPTSKNHSLWDDDWD